MITCDAVDILCDRLYSPNNQIKFASAVTLGYLTYNRTASRLLLHNCRNVPQLYNTLISILKSESKISRQFVESYETAYELGLPKLLVKNKVKFYESKEIEEPEFKGKFNLYSRKLIIDTVTLKKKFNLELKLKEKKVLSYLFYVPLRIKI